MVYFMIFAGWKIIFYQKYLAIPSPDFSAKNIYIFNYLIMKWL